MREIKFRAWDIRQRIMFGMWVLKNLCEQDGFYHADLIFMQYTGLKDKNGREIYEGDICQDKEDKIYEVRWNNLRARFVYYYAPENAHFTYQINEVQEPMKIIGNLFENPELTKELCK